jgi:hypothetical protein
MSVSPKPHSSRATPSTLLRFVNDHYRKTYRDDDGAMLGLLAMMVEGGRGPARAELRSWQQAVSRAVSH